MSSALLLMLLTVSLTAHHHTSSSLHYSLFDVSPSLDVHTIESTLLGRHCWTLFCLFRRAGIQFVAVQTGLYAAWIVWFVEYNMCAGQLAKFDFRTLLLTLTTSLTFLTVRASPFHCMLFAAAHVACDAGSCNHSTYYSNQVCGWEIVLRKENVRRDWKVSLLPCNQARCNRNQWACVCITAIATSKRLNTFFEGKRKICLSIVVSKICPQKVIGQNWW